MSKIVGIDLGTTNSALAHTDEKSGRIVSDEIVQLVGPGSRCRGRRCRRSCIWRASTSCRPTR
jgi:molecular chaperone DnaK (HSP70)